MTQSAMRKACLAIVKVIVGAHAIRTAPFCLGQDSRAVGAFEDGCEHHRNVSKDVNCVWYY